VPEAVDVGAEQGGGITEPHPGIDDAVVDDVAAGHRRAQGIVVDDVAVDPLDREVVDAARGTGTAQHHAHVFAARHQPAGHVRAEETARADHQLLRHA
jgi:hypothetical protein